MRAIKKKIWITTMSVFVAVLGLLFSFRSPVMAANQFTQDICSKISDPDQKAALGCEEENTAPKVATTLINSAIGILAVVCVGMLVVAGQRYIVAQGDASKIQQAKSMILYSIVGLIVAGLAFAIVNFIINSISSGQ